MGSLVAGDTIGTGTSTEELATEIGLTIEEIEWRQQFIAFDEEDADRLARLNELFLENKETFVDTFFDPIVEHDRTAEIVGRSPRDAEAIRQIIVGYYQTLTGGRYDREYYKHRTRIGRLHDRLDMPLHYFGGMSANIQNEFVDQIFDELIADLTGDSADTTAIEPHLESAKADLKAVIRGQNLDMQVINDTYLHSYSSKLTAEIEASRTLRNDIGTSVSEVSEQARGIETDMDRITASTESQSDHVDQLAGEISNLSASVEEIAASSEDVTETAKRTEETAHSGQSAAETAVNRIGKVAATSETVSGQMDELVNAIDQIEGIVDTIDQIADQTNLLALNASIEAARAGDAGAGFAVVADEVKSLAEESKQQADQVDSIIDTVTEQIDKTADSLAEAETHIDASASEVSETQAALDTVVEAAEETTQSITQVASATDEQASTSTELAATVDTVSEETQDVAEAVGSVRSAVGVQNNQLSAVEDALDELDEQVDDAGTETSRSIEQVAEDPSLVESPSPATDGGETIPKSLRAQLPDGIPSFVVDGLDREMAEKIARGEAEMPDFVGSD
jgi:methyl-accepting chemotaxis protein